MADSLQQTRAPCARARTLSCTRVKKKCKRKQGLGAVDLDFFLGERPHPVVPGDPPDAVSPGGQEAQGGGRLEEAHRRAVGAGAEEGGLEAHDIRLLLQRPHGAVGLSVALRLLPALRCDVGVC